MELKVWVEGIQRIVCGVNEKTTCQDVVFALAHATGKTGRFTLIERWRNSERLLAPNEQPLKVLMKWGEHSNDVQFILQWAPLDPANPGNKSTGKQPDPPNYLPFAKTPNSSTPASNSGSSTPTNNSQMNGPNKISINNISSSPAGGESPVDVNGLKKDTNVRSPLNFRPDMFGNGPSLSPSHGMANGKGFIGINNKILSNFSPDPSENSPGRRTKETSSACPPPYRDPPTPTKPGGLHKELPPYREPPPPNSRNNNSPVLSLTPNSTNSSNSGYSNSLGKNVSVVPSSSASNIFMGTNGGSSTSHRDSLTKLSSVTSQHDISSSSLSPLTSFGQTQPNDMTENESSRKFKDPSPITGEIPSTQMVNGSSTPKQSPVSPNSNNPQYRDLIRLINLQREKLTAQQAELTQYDAEIMFWEGKAREQQRNMDFITKEISRLELVSTQHESQVMSLAHVEEENEFVSSESEKLKSELNSLHSELAKCESELTQCKNRIRLLVEDLHSTQQQMTQRQEEWMQRETNTLAEIERLKKDLEIARRETDAVTDISGSLDKEVTSLESSLSDKKKQMDRLVAAMKEANLQSLTIQPPDELLDGGTHYRSGSTRRMIGSPRQLENAAPTSKNPHGVWV